MPNLQSEKKTNKAEFDIYKAEIWDPIKSIFKYKQST